MSRIIASQQREMEREMDRLAENGGQLVLNGAAFNAFSDFANAWETTPYVFSNDLARIISELRTANAIAESIQAGLQHDPNKLHGKCPRVKVVSGFDTFLSIETEFI